MATDFGAGCLGGMAGVVVGHPLDTVKVRLQTQCSRNPTYRGTFHCLKIIVANEGTRGLYRGLSSPIVGVAAVNALTFGIQANVRRLMSDPDCVSAQFRAGMVAGGCQAVVVSPMELVKSQLQVQSVTSGMGGRHYASSLDCCRQLLASQGVPGLMRGYWATVAREVPAFGLYFGTYELLTTGLTGDQRKSLPHMLLAGGLAGVASWLVTYPIDVVKTRVQTDGMAGVRRYSGYVDCVRQTLATEGWRGFVRGANSATIRAFPTNAVTLATVSMVLQLCRDRQLLAEPLFAGGDARPARPLDGQLLGQQLPLGRLDRLGQSHVTVTQMTVQIESSDGADSRRRRRATIRLDGQMALSELRRLLDREVAALQGRLVSPCSRALAPLSSQRTLTIIEPPVAEAAEAVEAAAAVGGWLETRRSRPEEAGRREDDEEPEERPPPPAQTVPCRRVRETTVVTHIVEYDVGDVDVGVSMSRMLEAA